MEPDVGDGSGLNALASLRRFVRPRAVRERCELCGVELADDHPHLVELANRKLRCACLACSLLFAEQTAPRFRRVPRRVQFLADFRLDDAQWESLNLPINLAFFLHHSASGRVVALYPSPAGVTESLLALEAWEALVEENPVLRQLEPDVEALLANRVGTAREHYRVGIDECYKLAGLVRTHWRGLSGGTEVWDEIGRFFAHLKARSS
jgi:hypothetical protein